MLLDRSLETILRLVDLRHVCGVQKKKKNEEKEKEKKKKKKKKKKKEQIIA